MKLLTGNSNKMSLIEVNCETDFVAKNEDFIKFVKELSETLTLPELESDLGVSSVHKKAKKKKKTKAWSAKLHGKGAKGKKGKKSHKKKHKKKKMKGGSGAVKSAVKTAKPRHDWRLSIRDDNLVYMVVT